MNTYARPLCCTALLLCSLAASAQIEMKLSVAEVLADPRTPATLYAGTPAGVLKSTDGGATWLQSPCYPLGRIQPPVYSLVLDPDNPAQLFLGTSRQRGLFWRSLDGGATWQQSAAGLPAGADGDTFIADLFSSVPALYGQLSTGGQVRIYRSTDRGATWSALGSAPRRVAIAPSNPDTMYYPGAENFVYRSDDGGFAWNRTGQVRPYAAAEYSGVNGVAVSPGDATTLLATMTGAAASLNGVFRSMNGGYTWVRTFEGNNIGVRYLRNRPSEVFAGDCCGNMSAYYSATGGQTWSSVSLNPNAIAGHFLNLSFAPHPVLSGVWFAATDTGVWKSADNLKTWTRSGTYRPTLVSDPDSFSGTLLTHDNSTLRPALTVRALEDPALPLTGFNMTPPAQPWIAAAASSTTLGALSTILSALDLEPGAYETSLRVSATGFVNSTLDIPVRLQVAGQARAPRVFTGSLAGGSGSYAALAADPQGNLAVARSNRVERINSDQTRTVLVGTGVYGYSGDNGPAANAQIRTPDALAFDAAGNLYLIDWFVAAIRKVDRSGVITRIVGADSGAFAASGSPAASRFSTIRALALDPAGALHFSTGDRIWKLQANGTVLVVAGGGALTGENISGRNAKLGNVKAMAFDAAGNLYYSDAAQHVVRRMTPDFNISTTAGTGEAGFSGDGAKAAAALLNAPGAVALDPGGNVYFADGAGTRIRRVTPDGQIDTLAGTGAAGRVAPCTAAETAPLGAVAGLLWRGDATLAVLDTAASDILGLWLGSATAEAAPTLTAGGIVNAASFVAPVAPGSIFTLFGERLAAATLTPPWTARAGSTVACLDGRAVPLYYASGGQLNGQVPYETPAGDRWARVFTAAGSSAPQRVPVAAAAPGVFQYGAGRAIAVNADGSLNGPDSGAAPGSFVTVYLTGIGKLDNAVPTGQTAPAAPLSRPTAAVKAAIGGQTADVYFIGLSPGFVGLAQANIKIPDLPPGDYALSIEIGGAASASTQLRVR